MRRAWLLFVPLAAILAAAAAAPAAVPEPPALQPFSDPRGLYTIGFPSMWSLKPQEVHDRTIRNGVLGEGRLSIVSARAEDRRTLVVVIAGLLRSPMSAREFAEASPIEPEDDEVLTVVQEGATRIGGRDAYYRYINSDSPRDGDHFGMFVYVVAGRVGFQLWGITPRDAAHLQQSVPLVRRIIESFRVGKIP